MKILFVLCAVSILITIQIATSPANAQWLSEDKLAEIRENMTADQALRYAQEQMNRCAGDVWYGFNVSQTQMEKVSGRFRSRIHFSDVSEILWIPRRRSNRPPLELVCGRNIFGDTQNCVQREIFQEPRIPYGMPNDPCRNRSGIARAFYRLIYEQNNNVQLFIEPLLIP